MQILKGLFQLFKNKLSLAVIFVEYDRSKGASDKIFKKLQGYLANIKDCEITYLRVDNKREDGDIKQDGNIYTVSGDNTFREFSGWQRGIKAIDSLKLNCDLVLITNEMFLKPGPSFLQDYATRETLKRCLTNNKIIGRVDTVSQHYTVFGYDVSSWICTNAFFAPRKAFGQLESVVLINDNIHNIFTRDYSRKHLLYKSSLTATNQKDNNFHIEIDLPENCPKEIRFKFDSINDNTPPEILLTEIWYNGSPCPHNFFIRGIDTNETPNKIAQTFLLSLPHEPGKLILKCFVPPEFYDKLHQDLLQISVYNDCYLYQKNASINITYQRWLIEWLTERWHSKFDINAGSWALFKTKAAAIINESLLTAKFSELGYTPESYGDKKYY